MFVEVARPIPAGTELVVRLRDTVDSEAARAGQTIRAILDEPVAVEGDEAAPRGAEVTLQLVEVKAAELSLRAVSCRLNGRAVAVSTHAVTLSAAVRSGSGLLKATGGAALAAIIAAAAGGPAVKVPAETRLTFILAEAATL